MKRREVNRSNGGRQGYSQRLSLRATGVSEDEEQRIYLKKQGSNFSGFYKDEHQPALPRNTTIVKWHQYQGNGRKARRSQIAKTQSWLA